MTTEEIVRLYTVDLLSLRAIATCAGVSHVTIRRHLRSAAVTMRPAERPAHRATATCAYCGASFRRNVRKLQDSAKNYCQLAHYLAHVRGANYHQWRYGQKIARRVVLDYFALQPGHVVHHHDGDNGHNAVENLAVFASQAEHMRYHRGGDATPVWDGRALGTATLTT